ncbi:MAG TPA: nuclear transport factor 2 family protein [Dyadobacter sp.]|nr:nuclear transport factor 2 family protein [Dyadobacter sp.]
MDTSKLDKAVKAAFDAWQAGDAKTWLSYFAPDAKLYDDGRPRDFRSFVTQACGHERFTSIDEVKDNGLSVYGNFHTESWGDFRTYFKFHLNSQGKFDRLDIGQATN